MISKLAVALLVGFLFNYPLHRYIAAEESRANPENRNPWSKESRLSRTRRPLPRARAQGFALMAGIMVEKASVSTVTDVDGNTSIDIIGEIGGIEGIGLGHSHPRWVKAMQAQVENASVGSFTSVVHVELFEQIAKNPPAPGVNRMQLYSGGAETVESALRLAKCHIGKYEFVSFWGGFHGKTMGALSLMGSEFKDSLGPMVWGSHHIVLYAKCYRCPINLKPADCGIGCVELATNQAKKGSAGKVAGVIV